jgi:outer membrane protein assembly factor BamA
MLKLLLVIAGLWTAAAVKDDFREPILPEVRSNTLDVNSIRFYRDGEKTDLPVPLRDSLRQALAHDDQMVTEAVKRVLGRHFTDSGYLSAGIDSIVFQRSEAGQGDRIEAADTLPVFEGPRTVSVYATSGCRYRIGTLDYSIADADENLMDRFISFYGNGDLFDGPALQDEFRRVIRHLERQGYPLVQLELADFHPDFHTCLVDIEANVFAGEELRASGVVTNEVRQVRPEYIQMASGVRENDKITPDLFRRGRRNLENTGFFREVSDGDLMIRDGNTYIYYEVNEQRANHFDLIFGYVPGQSAGRDLVGRGEMRIRNVGWTGSSLHLMFERLDDMVTKLETGFDREWIMGQPLGAGADFRFVQQDTSYQIREIHLMGSYRRSPERRYSLHLTQRHVSAGDDPNLPVTVLDGVTRAAGFGFRIDNTDSRIAPRSGILFDLYVESGFRRVDDPRAETLQSRGTMMQQRVRTSLKTFYSPFRRQVLALGIHGSLVESPEYTETDVIPLGGARSLRGYREEQFRVARYAWSDLELRYLLDPVSHAFLFGAVGAYERPPMLGREERSTQGWLYSGGFGFRFQTPIGIVQFTYAVSADDDLHNGKVHFSLSAGF